MSMDPEEAQARINKALENVREMQKKFASLTPEQRAILAEKLKGRKEEMSYLQGKLEQLSGVIGKQQVSLPDRVAKKVIGESNFVAKFRKLKTRRELGGLWGDGWLIPVDFAGKKASLIQGKNVKVFWSETMLKIGQKNDTLLAIGDAWNKAPALALPALITHISSLITDEFGPDAQNKIMPFNMTATILVRMVIEIQLQAGLDPAPTTGLESFLDDVTLVAAAETPKSQINELTLRSMLVFGWVAAILADS